MRKKLAELEMTSNKTAQQDEEEDDEYVLFSDTDEDGELRGEALAQAELAAAARPGVPGRLEQAIGHIISRGRVTDNPNSLAKRDADHHFEGEPASNGRVWRHING